jgi:hypothetical protein
MYDLPELEFLYFLSWRKPVNLKASVTVLKGTPVQCKMKTCRMTILHMSSGPPLK